MTVTPPQVAKSSVCAYNLIAILLCVLLVWFIASELDRYFVNRPLLDHYRQAHWTIAPLNLYLRSQMRENERNSGLIPINEHTFPNVHLLRDNFSVIRDEALAAYAESKTIDHEFFFERIADKGWKRFHLKWYGPIDERAKTVCPQTVSILNQMPNVKLAMFSILEPGSRILAHSGLYRGIYRYHLGIQTPNDDNCYININGEKYSWRDSEDVLFDDTFYHEVVNDTTSLRIVLFIDVQRPMTSQFANDLNKWFIKNIVPFSSRQNDKQEKAITESR